MQVDPEMESTANFGGYTFTLDNPAIYIDPMGLLASVIYHDYTNQWINILSGFNNGYVNSYSPDGGYQWIDEETPGGGGGGSGDSFGSGWENGGDSFGTNGRDGFHGGGGRKKSATDAGHGNRGDVGAVAGTNYEKDYALLIENSTNKWLTIFGIDNIRTRSGDTNYKDGFSWRYNKANNFGADIFVSFHLNGGTTSDDIYVIYQQDQKNEGESINLAKDISNSLSNIMHVPQNSIAKVKDRTRFQHLAVLKNFAGKAGVLVEFGSIQNEKNRNFIKSQYSKIGFSVALGMYRYLNNGNYPWFFLNF